MKSKKVGENKITAVIRKSIVMAFVLFAVLSPVLASENYGPYNHEYETVFDADFSEWYPDIPHTTLTYNPDWDPERLDQSYSAIESYDEGYLFHVYSFWNNKHPRRTYDFSECINVSYRDQIKFQLKMVLIDPNDPDKFYAYWWDLPNLDKYLWPDGTFHLAIYENTVWNQFDRFSQTPEYCQQHYPVLGEAKLSYNPYDGALNQIEFNLDNEAVVQFVNESWRVYQFGKITTDDLSEVSVYYTELGYQSTSHVGTPTGPVMGISLCLGAVGLFNWFKGRKKGLK